jgi:kynurenine formamidase
MAMSQFSESAMSGRNVPEEGARRLGMDLPTLVNTLTGNYRIVDLSAEIIPGNRKVTGHYTWGTTQRLFEIEQFIAPGPHFMHFVRTESHVGTHVEVPAHILDGAASCAEMPLETFMGEAIVLKFGSLQPTPGGRRLIRPEHLADVRGGDIVMMWSPFAGDDVPVISAEAAATLAEKPIKMLGIQNVDADNDTHEALLLKEDAPIPIIEQVVSLETLTAERFLFFGLPLRVLGLDSSWIRAIAFEPSGGDASDAAGAS